MLGPRNGPYEELAGNSSPLFEYISGVLAPAYSFVGERSIDVEAEIPFGDSGRFEDETDDVHIYLPPYISPVLNPKARPPSMGIAFTVEVTEGKPILSICITWARYFYIREKNTWKRHPRFFIKKFVIDRDTQVFINGEGQESDPEQAEISLHIL
ncbi:MAG: hypothetical protein DRN61_05705, partial [Thaumarchaeota archaeon]